jgi:hypothetical protein
MMFKTTLIATLLGASAATELASNSKAGAKLLSKARRVNQNYEEDFSWMAGYSLKFEGCHSIHAYGGEEQKQEDGQSPFGVTHLAKFHLCASDKSCKSCAKGGEYMVSLQEFAESYLEAQKEMQEYNCQNVEANCNCNYYYGDDQACLNKCYSDAGLDYCVDDGNDFDAAEYMECREAEFQGNNNGYYEKFYIGPYCSHSGTTVNLAVFTDAQCTTKASSGTYEKYNYGYTLPYSSEPLIGTKCMSCLKEDDNNNYYAEASETCQQLYEGSAKCERNLAAKNKYTKDTGSCDYIHKIVPALETVYHKGGHGASTGLAVFFSLTTIGFAGAAYYFYTQVSRSTVNLANKDGGNFA